MKGLVGSRKDFGFYSKSVKVTLENSELRSDTI